MHIGDLLLVTPVLRTLRTNYPHAYIALLTDKLLADLVRYNKHINECLLIDKKGRDDNLLALIKFIGKLRRKKFDLVINLHRNERASAIAAFSGAKKIVGYSKPGFSLFFTKVMPNQKAVKHQIHSHFDVLREAVGVTKIDDGGLEMWLPREAKSRIKKLWRENFAAHKVVALNIGASWLTKRWESSYFAKVADWLTEKGYGVAFLGGPTDREIVAKCHAQMAMKDSPLVKVFTGQLTLAEVGAFLEKCVLFITTDSGPMHIGVAMKVPIVTMFGSSPVPGFYPYDAKDVLLKTPEPCHPCGIHVCPKKGDAYMACMKKILPETVIKYAEELLTAYGQSAKDIPRVRGAYECRVVEL